MATTAAGFWYPDEGTSFNINTIMSTAMSSVETKAGPLTVDTGWVALNLTLPAGWSVPGGSSSPLVRVIGKMVYFRGALLNPGFTGGFTTVANLPGGVPRPLSDNVASLNSNSAAVRSARITSQGLLQVYSSLGSGAFFYLSPLSYPIG